jgi:hypothetical protein
LVPICTLSQAFVPGNVRIVTLAKLSFLASDSRADGLSLGLGKPLPT